MLLDWERLLHEDLGEEGDITSALLPDPQRTVKAEVIGGEYGIFAGEKLLQELHEFSEDCVCTMLITDGTSFTQGTVLFTIDGSAKTILGLERTLLNVLQISCGIATETNSWVKKAAPTKIIDTRKTHPGLRAMEKYAVKCGGGNNHRIGLFDKVMFKDNHLLMLDDYDQIIWPPKAVVEIEDWAQLKYFLHTPVLWFMLDNWNRKDLPEAIREIRNFPMRRTIELSGGVTYDDLEVFGTMGADYISTSAITLRAKPIDISLAFVPHETS
jgi:nicotinate-nucleotide pyrophosphorylase (carboxylating)